MSLDKNFMDLVDECLEKYDSKEDVIDCIDTKQNDLFLFDKKLLEREILNQFASKRDLKLTDVEKKILKFLHKSDGSSQKDIALNLNMAKSQVSVYINKLLKRDIIWKELFNNFMSDRKNITMYHVDKHIMEWI